MVGKYGSGDTTERATKGYPGQRGTPYVYQSEPGSPDTPPDTHSHTHVHMQYTCCGVKRRAKRYLTLTAAQNCFSFSVSLIQVGGVRSVTLPESLLFVSTLDGSLHAVSKQSGDIKWTLREGSYASKSRPFLIVISLCSFQLNRSLISFRPHYSSPRVPHRVSDTCPQHQNMCILSI